jgi:hypothetical protein
MSIKVSVLCENHTHDQYLITPVVKAALSHLGKPNAIVDVKPIAKEAQGVDQLSARMCSHLSRWGGPSDIVVFVADADCEDGRRGRRDRRARLLSELSRCADYAEKACVLVALQEAEVWALWGARATLGVPWADVLAECDPKERFFEGLLGDRATPDEGRTHLMRDSLRAGWQSLRGGCSELTGFEQDLRVILGL